MLLPTGLGFKALTFFAVLVGAFYAAPYMNLFFLLLSFLAVMAVLSVWWTWRNVVGIDGEVLQPEPVAAGKSCMLAIVARSAARRPRLRHGRDASPWPRLTHNNPLAERQTPTRRPSWLQTQTPNPSARPLHSAS